MKEAYGRVIDLIADGSSIDWKNHRHYFGKNQPQSLFGDSRIRHQQRDCQEFRDPRNESHDCRPVESE